MPTSVINRRLSLNLVNIQEFILEQIHGLIRIYNVCGVKDERALDLFYNVIILDPVTTPHISQFPVMWPHSRSRSSAFREWWAAFHSYMGKMSDETCDQINNSRWDNPRALGDQVDCSYMYTTSSEKVKCTCEHFCWYGSNDLRAKIEPQSCRQYKPGDKLATRPLNWDGIIDEDGDDDKWVDPGVLSCGRSRPGNGNENDDGESEDNMQGGEKGRGHGQEQWIVRGKGRQLRMGRAKGRGRGRQQRKGRVRGRGRETVKGNVLLNKPQREMISLVPRLCSCRRKCIGQTWTQRAN